MKLDEIIKKKKRIRNKLKKSNKNNKLRLTVYRSSKNISAVAGLAIYSKKKWLGGVSVIENLVKPCKDPLEPLPSTVPDIS